MMRWLRSQRPLVRARVLPVCETERGMTKIDSRKTKRMVRNILTARPDEIGCSECLKRMDRFVEMELEGRDAAKAMPLVEDHLNRCGDCREEFEALLDALRHLQQV